MSIFKRRPTKPYMPAILEAARNDDAGRATDLLRQATADYYGRISKIEGTIPVEDAAIIINLHHHIANELGRADPYAAQYAKALGPVTLPPIEFTKN